MRTVISGVWSGNRQSHMAYPVFLMAPPLALTKNRANLQNRFLTPKLTMLTPFDSITRLFGNGNNSDSSNKSKTKRQRRRSCRIEELESREMLNADPLASVLVDIFSQYDETALYSGGLTPPAPVSNDANVDVHDDLRTPAQAIPSGNWGTITSKMEQSDSWDHKGTGFMGLTPNANNLNGSFTFSLAHAGDAGSYIELYGFVSGLGEVKGSNTYLTLDGQRVNFNGGKDANSGTIRISLEGTVFARLSLAQPTQIKHDHLNGWEKFVGTWFG
jgi:hypothetical protein